MIAVEFITPNTQTLNALGTYSVTPDDRMTFKAIENKLTTDLSVRLAT